MVDMIEGSFRDLKRIDMQGELSNSTVVGMIEEKLPKSVKTRWCLEICDDGSTSPRKHAYQILF